ncbi:MAG: PIN domain-containing protein, partial [Burkholderiales bacterium]
MSALLGGSAANALVAECLRGRFLPLLGAALFAEYEAQLRRAGLFGASRLTAGERDELFDMFVAASRWTRIYYGWRPNLRDEGDNHVVELAIAGNAQAIVTRNTRDFVLSAQLRFPHLRIATPRQM